MRTSSLRVCPHCAQPLRPVRFGVMFGPLAAQIIDIIAAAGPTGVSGAELLREVYRNGTGLSALRSNISAINVALAPQGIAIRSQRQVYRVTRRGGSR